MDSNDLGDYDIVLASRCLNGIYNIRNTLLTLNEIANKYVYITVFGSKSHKYKKENNLPKETKKENKHPLPPRHIHYP